MKLTIEAYKYDQEYDRESHDVEIKMPENFSDSYISIDGQIYNIEELRTAIEAISKLVKIR